MVQLGRRKRSVLLALLVVVSMAGPAYAVPYIYLDVGGQGPNGEITSSSGVEVSIFASEIPPGGDGFGMFGFGANVSFDPAGLSAGVPEFGPQFFFTGFDSTSSGVGSVGATSNRFFQASGPIGDDILLATINFTGLTKGLYTLSVAHFTGPGDNTLYDFTTLDASLDFFQGGSILVTVPEPSTAMLLGFGLLVLNISRRRSS